MSGNIKKEFTCIVCPIGCRITSEQAPDGSVVSITGNTCPRGERYVKSELTHPVRMLTTTMATTDGRIIPVRTSIPIAKELLFDAMEIINASLAPEKTEPGDVIIKNVLSTGADIIATGK